MTNRTVYWNTLESTQNIVATSPAVLFAAAAQNHHPGSPELSGPAPPWAACGTLAFPSAVLLPRLGTVSFRDMIILCYDFYTVYSSLFNSFMSLNWLKKGIILSSAIYFYIFVCPCVYLSDTLILVYIFKIYIYFFNWRIIMTWSAIYPFACSSVLFFL